MFESANTALFFLINNGLHGSLGDAIIGNATYLGIGWVVYPLTLLILWLVDRQNIIRNVLLLALAAISEGIVLQIVKSLVDSPRPLAYFADQIKPGKVVVYVMFEPLVSRSFPSGHTQSAFCAATVIALAAKGKLGRHSTGLKASVPIAFILATLVGISRIYVGAHFPSDALGGAIIGIFPVYFFRRTSERLGAFLTRRKPVGSARHSSDA